MRKNFSHLRVGKGKFEQEACVGKAGGRVYDEKEDQVLAYQQE